MPTTWRFAALTGMVLISSALAAPLTVTPQVQDAKAGAVVTLAASEVVNWSTTGGVLGSTQGTRVVLELPKTPGTVTVTVQDPKDPTRKAFAVVRVGSTVIAPQQIWTHTFAAGNGFSVAVSQDGSVWVWGRNDLGQLPGRPAGQVNVPTQVEGLGKIQGVEARNFYDSGYGTYPPMALALSTSGDAWAWGGMTGRPKAIMAGATHIAMQQCALAWNDQGLMRYYMAYWDQPREMTTKLKGNIVSAIARRDGEVQSLYFGQDGKLTTGQGCVPPSPTATDEALSFTQAAQVGNSAFLLPKNDGTVQLFANGRLQDVSTLKDARQIAASVTSGPSDAGWGFALGQDGTVSGFTYANEVGVSYPSKVQGLTDVIDIRVSQTHALFLKRDGTLWALGNNEFGQLGDGSYDDSSVPVQVVGLRVLYPGR